MAAENGFPIPMDGAERLCIHCGHCVAVCPEGALSMKGMRPEDCFSAGNCRFITLEEMERLIYTRRSIRNFTGESVDKGVLGRLIKAANYSPSIKNVQPVHWLVILKRSEVRRLASIVIEWMRSMLQDESKSRYSARILNHLIHKWNTGVDLICHGAPHLIVVHAHKDSRASATSCIIAMTTFELAAHSHGLGTCWAGYLCAAAAFYPPMFEALELPEDHQCFAAMMIGYPKFEYPRIPLKRIPPIVWR